MKYHVLIIDDDEKITSMLQRGLAFEGYRVSISNEAIAGLQLVASDTPHVVILDVMMPRMDGWEVCRRIRESGSRVPILMLTAKDDIEDRVRGLDLGADDYLVKPFAFEELLARIRALLRRNIEEAEHSSHRLTFEDIVMDTDSREVFRHGKPIELTTKEFDLLHIFMLNQNKVLSRDQLMERIWGFDFSGESNVLEVYVALLRQKLESLGGSRVIQTIRGAGYVLRGEG